MFEQQLQAAEKRGRGTGRCQESGRLSEVNTGHGGEGMSREAGAEKRCGSVVNQQEHGAGRGEGQGQLAGGEDPLG